jgi:hypothetical protein
MHENRLACKDFSQESAWDEGYGKDLDDALIE